jgi:hypothetical protein
MSARRRVPGGFPSQVSGRAESAGEHAAVRLTLRGVWGAEIRCAPREIADLQAGRKFRHSTGIVSSVSGAQTRPLLESDRFAARTHLRTPQAVETVHPQPANNRIGLGHNAALGWANVLSLEPLEPFTDDLVEAPVVVVRIDYRRDPDLPNGRVIR